MNIKCLSLIVSVFLLSGLSACSTIKSWFPDKEKDYQFTSEIPALIIPDDLKNNSSASLPARPTEKILPEPDPVTGSRYTTTAEEAEIETTSSDLANTADENVVEAKPESITNSTTASTLQIDQGQNAATRTVGKALTRQKLEVVERNIDKGYFYVKFDPKAQKVTDDSVWDEFNFFFGDEPSQEEEYRVTVQALSAAMSEVTVQNSKGESLSNATANALLGLIVQGINNEPRQPAQAAPEEATTEQPATETDAGQSALEQPATEQQ